MKQDLVSALKKGRELRVFIIGKHVLHTPYTILSE